jgi:DNA-directed RNA polymerase specialized sigma24 family protein
MSRIARRALLPSLIATAALVSPAVAAGPRATTPTNGTTTDCARPSAQVRCPTCERLPHHRPTAVRELLADGQAIEATRAAVRSLLASGPEDAEEAAQEAALRAMTKDLRACCDQGLQRWMFRTAKNYLLDAKRKKRESLLSAATADEDSIDFALPPSAEIGPQQIAALDDQVHHTLARFDLDTMSDDKKVLLGRALNDHLMSGHALRRYLPRASVLVDAAPAAVDAIRPHS